VNRRTLDLLVPFAYAIAVVIAVFVGNAEWVGIIATVGALLVGAYYAALRPTVKKVDPSS
jgi:membrane associated rhomboid family serine protease